VAILALHKLLHYFAICFFLEKSPFDLSQIFRCSFKHFVGVAGFLGGVFWELLRGKVEIGFFSQSDSAVN